MLAVDTEEHVSLRVGASSYHEDITSILLRKSKYLFFMTKKNTGYNVQSKYGILGAYYDFLGAYYDFLRAYFDFWGRTMTFLGRILTSGGVL